MRSKSRPFALLFILLTCAFATVGSSLEIIHSMVDDERLVLVFKENSGQQFYYDNAEIRIGNTPLESCTVSTLDESDLPITTLFLVDSSRTVLTGETQRISQIAESFSENPTLSRGNRSTFFVQIFGDNITPVMGPTYDPDEMVEEIRYTSETADYYYALSEAIDFFNERAESGIIEKQQIVLISDATRFSENNISEAQLRVKIKRSNAVIYGVVLYNSLTENVAAADLQRLQKLTGISHGFVISSKEADQAHIDPAARIMTDILDCYVATGTITASIPRDSANTYGLTLSILNLDTKVSELDDKAYLRLPTVLPTETPTPTMTATFTATPTEMPTETPAPVPEETEIPAPEEEDIDEEPEKKVEIPEAFSAIYSWLYEYSCLFDSAVPNYLIVGSGVLLLILIVVILSSVAKAGKISRGKQPGGLCIDINICRLMSGNAESAAAHTKLYVNRSLLFGRTDSKNVIGLAGDDTVSAVHFKLTYSGGFVFIEDMGAANGTILNGSRIRTKEKVRSGDILLLGQLTYRIRFE